MASLSKWTLFGAILASGWFGRTIVLILFIISIIALAIFIKKVRDFRKIASLNKTFIAAFRKTQSLEEFYKISSKFGGPLSNLFEQGYKYKNSQQSTVNSQQNSKDLQDISGYINSLVLQEKRNFEGCLIFLATTATISPFLGLLGTVWGILTCFMDIRTYGSAHINVVAPGIAESLITTVVGLCVAIPAVVFYNYSMNRANKLADEVDAFSKELTDRLESKSLKV